MNPPTIDTNLINLNTFSMSLMSTLQQILPLVDSTILCRVKDTKDQFYISFIKENSNVIKVLWPTKIQYYLDFWKSKEYTDAVYTDILIGIISEICNKSLDEIISALTGDSIAQT